MTSHPQPSSFPLSRIKHLKSLSTSKGRLKNGLFLVEGEKAIQQIMMNHQGYVSEVIQTKSIPAFDTQATQTIVTENQFKKISQTHSPQGILAIVRFPDHIYGESLPLKPGKRILLLEDVQDPGNAGTLIRTAAAFGFSGVIMTDQCADPLSPKCIQSTAGSVFSVWIRRTPKHAELTHTLKEQGYRLITTDLDGNEDVSIFAHRAGTILALGNEGSGISKRLLLQSDFRFKIPLHQDKINSLNVATCGAICMYLSSRDNPSAD